MADRLIVVSGEVGGPEYRIQWELQGDEFDMGAYCGQSKTKPSDEIPSDLEEREFWAYERAGFQTIEEGPKGYCGHDSTGFWWETKASQGGSCQDQSTRQSHLEQRTLA
jgi:hypothetical protein